MIKITVCVTLMISALSAQYFQTNQSGQFNPFGNYNYDSQFGYQNGQFNSNGNVQFPGFNS